MQTQFDQLQANLSEIYAALHSQSNSNDLSLGVSSSSSVYFQKCFIGQIKNTWNKAWCWIQLPSHSTSVEDALQMILTTLFDRAVHSAYHLRQRRIWHHMRQIDQIRENSLHSQDVLEQQKRYAKYLAEELEESVEIDHSIHLVDFDKKDSHFLSVQQMTALRHTIVNFHQATYLFWSLFLKDQKENGSICQPLMHLIKPSSTLMDRALFKALKKEGRWVQMEGVMQQEIPTALFAKLEDPQSLTLKENKCLKRWVKILNQSQHEISYRLFSCILNEIMDIIRLQGSSALTLSDLLEWLDQQGCSMIHLKDPAHLDWREKLCEGDSIECNGKSLILGPQMSPDKLIHDTFKIFELAEYPDYVVKIAHNPFLLLMEDKKSRNEKDHWGIRLVETVANIEQDNQKLAVSGLDHKGRCVVLEKLFFAFDTYNWTSQSLELTKEDENIALVFANHLFCMSQWKATAQKLSFAHLMWDKEGRLKSTRLLKKGVANYNEWESYCEEAAKGNFYVLSFLMNVSKLSKHKISSYYREAIEYTLRTGKTDLIGRPLPLGYRQEFYLAHIKKLCAQAQELRQNCFDVVTALLRRKNQYSYKQEGQFQKAVAEKLIKFYRASPTPGRFLPHFEQQIVDSFSDISNKTYFPDPGDAAKYYQEKYEQMMNFNQAVL